MNGLEERFGGQIDFLHLDINQRIADDVRFQFNLVTRTQYALIDAEGNIVKTWFGYLDEAEIEGFLAEYVATL